jgi:SET domain-containing protein
LVKPVNYISEAIYVAKASDMGRGVFASADIRKNTIIEIAPVIVLSGKDRTFIDQTLLHNYIFEWGERQEQCCMALGYVPLYNHSYQSNCEYEMNFKKEIITVRTVRSVKAGEELFINYNGDWNNKKLLWFQAK